MEFIDIFMNGRGLPAQGVIPPGIFGHEEAEAGFNPVVYDWVDGSEKQHSDDVCSLHSSILASDRSQR